jgi:IS5 family transposase
MRRFAGIELGDDRIPGETTILNFRHLLERHGLTEAIFAEVNAHLADNGITLRSAKAVFENNVLGGKFLFLQKNYSFKL